MLIPSIAIWLPSLLRSQRSANSHTQFLTAHARGSAICVALLAAASFFGFMVPGRSTPAGGRGRRGGRGCEGPAAEVRALRWRGLSEEQIRAHLRDAGYSAPRISQLMKNETQSAITVESQIKKKPALELQTDIASDTEIGRASCRERV